jgi:predicted CoA-substrate-specific enzyme activase
MPPGSSTVANNKNMWLGIDIGSRYSKGVIVQGRSILWHHLLSSGTNYGAAAETLVQTLLGVSGLSVSDISGIMATGVGAANVPFSSGQSGDIRCCAKGVRALFPSVRTVIDVQSMTSQVIRISDEGLVSNFVVSEKCASGAGRFLEVLSDILRVQQKDIGPLSLMAKNPVPLTTGCAVFAESEVISMISQGLAKEDLVAGVHKALATKISSLVDRVGLEKECAITGGGGLDVGLIKRLEDTLGVELLVPDAPQFVNALGAALIAQEGQGDMTVRGAE